MSARLSKSLADVTRRKGRTLLVVLGIFIGVLGLTTINFTEDTIFAAYSYSQGVHVDWPDVDLAVDRLDPALLPGLRAVPNVRTVQYQTIFRTEWYISRAPGHVEMAIDSYPDLAQIAPAPFQLTSGRLPGVGEIVLESSDQAFQAVAIGATVSVNAPGGPAPLRVVGLARIPGTTGSDRALGFMSDAGLQQLTGDLPAAAPGKAALVHSIMVRVADVSQATATAAALHIALQAGGVTVLDTAFPRAITVPLSQIDGVFSLLRLLVGLALAVTGLLIVHTVTTLVAEQTAIIGTLKAIGGTRRAIVQGYLVSVSLYSVLATLPGLILGLAGGWLLATALAPTIPLDLGPFTVAPAIPAFSLAVGLGLPLLAALVPLWTGTRISVRDALAAYGVSAGAGNGRLARLGARLPWISQTAWLGLRGPFRQPGRTALTLLTLAVAGAGFLVVQTATGSINHTVVLSQSTLAADVNVQLRNQQPFGPIRAAVSALPNVARVERYAANHTATAWGDISLIGVEPDTQLYHYQLTGGRWLRPGDTDVVLLSDDAAARMGLRIGSTLRLPATNGQTATWTVAGTVKQPVDVFGWIGAVVLPINTLTAFEGVPAAQLAGATSDVVIQARDHAPDAVDALARAADSALNPPAAQADHAASIARVETFADYTARRERSWYILYALLYGVVLVVGAAGVLGLANALTATVLERRREIGLLRALGAGGWRVARVFWVEGLVLAGLAWIAGAALGLPLAWAFVRLLSRLVVPVDFVVEPAAFGVMLAAVLAIATLASIGPAWHAARLRIAGILRYE